MADRITITINPPDLIQRMRRYPDELRDEMEKSTRAALAHVQGSVPSYPPARPESRYRRTGTLGRSIGSGGGRAAIYTVEAIGGGYEGTLGTRLEYAPQVIGPDDQTPFFAGRGWWTLDAALERAEPGIERIYEHMCKRMAARLDG